MIRLEAKEKANFRVNLNDDDEELLKLVKVAIKNSFKAKLGKESKLKEVINTKNKSMSKKSKNKILKENVKMEEEDDEFFESTTEESKEVKEDS